MTRNARPNRILISTKFRFIGDTLLAIPALIAVRHSWPDAHITLLTGRKAAVLLKNNPLLNSILEFEPTGRDQGLRNFFRIIRQIRKEKFDTAITLNRSFHSALIPALSSISTRVGWSSEGRGLLLNRSVPYNTTASEIDCYFDVLKLIHAQIPSNCTPRLWISESERTSAKFLLDKHITENLHDVVLVGVQPGASLEIKRWSVARFAALANGLAAQFPHIKLMLLGGPDEVDTAERMYAELSVDTQLRTLNLTGMTDLRGSIALLETLTLFIGNDTAVLHCAAAVGVATVALFGPTNADKWGSTSNQHRIIKAPNGTMDQMSVESVLQECGDRLEELLGS